MTTETIIADLHTAIVATLLEQFPALQTCEFYREDRETLPVPACLLDMSEMESDEREEAGTDQLAAHFRFEAELVLPFRTAQGKLEIRKQATAFATYLHQRSRWPGVLQEGRIKVIGAYKSDFQPELDRYEVWRIEWRQLLKTGASVWDEGEATTPTTVFFGQPPDIGPGNEENYVQVHP